jgi:hypothetical protein
MAELPPNGVDVAIEVGRIAAAPGGIADRAEALLEPLHRVIPFEGAWTGLLDPDTGTFVPLHLCGVDERSLRYI